MSGFTLWSDLNQMFQVHLIMTPFGPLTCWELGAPKDECIGEDGAMKYNILSASTEGE
jgi:hypothetical protein